MADLNGDGHLDIGVSNLFSNTVSIWLGTGTGQFQVKSHFQPAGVAPQDLVFCNLNGDSILDLVVANEIGQSLTTSLGNGDGTFTEVAEYFLGRALARLATGFVNSDSMTDVAALDASGNTWTYLGNGDGTLGVPIGLATGANDLVLDDLDLDGKVDLAVAGRSTQGGMKVYWGLGNGTFSAGVVFPAPRPSVAIAKADFDKDGRLDLAVGPVSSPDRFSVFLGRPGRTFTAAASYQCDVAISDIAAGDVDGDGWTDVAFAGNDLTISYNQGNGTFVQAQDFAAGLSKCAKCADLNGDGSPDLVVSNGAGLSVFMQTSGGSFLPAASIPVSGGISFFTIADIDKDNVLDVAGVNTNLNSMSVLFGTGGGGFGPPTTYTTGTWPAGVVTYDVDHDGNLDLLTTNLKSDDISVFLGLGGGTLAPRYSIPTGPSPEELAFGDLDGDGLLDIVVAGGGFPPGVYVHRNLGGGAFGAGVLFLDPAGPKGIVLADMNQDGNLDALTASIAGEVAVWSGDGNAGFTGPARYSVLVIGSTITVADFNGDGELDVAIDGTGPNAEVSVLLGQGCGLLGQRVDYGTGHKPSFVKSYDVNRDNAPDLVVANAGSQTVSILYNISGAYVVGVPEAPAPHISGVTLGTPYPNPSFDSLRLPFIVGQSGRVRIDVFDALGHRVTRLLDDIRTAGRYEVVWDGRNPEGLVAPAGIYFARPEGQGDPVKIVRRR